MLNKEELQNLEIIFTLARQAAVNNEEQLIGVISFKKELFNKFEKLNSKPESKSEAKPVQEEVTSKD